MSVADPRDKPAKPRGAQAVENLVVVPQRHYGIWVGTIVALALISRDR